MEAENSLTITKQISDELFFEEEARRLREIFVGARDANQLRYLRGVLQTMKEMMQNLELPWDSLIPILFRNYAVYMLHPDPEVSNKKTYRSVTMLIERMNYMAQHKDLLHHTALFLESQIADIDKLMAKSDEDTKTEEIVAKTE